MQNTLSTPITFENILRIYWLIIIHAAENGRAGPTPIVFIADNRFFAVLK